MHKEIYEAIGIDRVDDNIGLKRDSDTLNNLYSLLLACLANSEMDFVGSFNQIEKNISKIVSLEKIENMTNFGTISREDTRNLFYKGPAIRDKMTD